MVSNKVRHLLLFILLLVLLDSCACWGTRTSGSRPRPSPTHRPFPRPSPTHRPFPSPTHRPFPSPTHRPFPSPTYRPFPQPTHRPFPKPTQRPYPQPTYKPFPQPTRYPTQPRYPVGPHPSYPGYGNGGIFAPGRPYQPSYNVPVRIPAPGGSRIRVYNVRNYHPSTYWAPPSYPIYHYTYRDTGSSALGFYLGYSLGRITHPTYYYHHHGYDGYSPRYDHYTVHHYYHNTGNIPKEQTVVSKSIIQCEDSSQICPVNTTALCKTNGEIMCLVAATRTIPCKHDSNVRCIRSMIPCENNDSSECKGVAKGQSASIDIPCISNTIIDGNITTVNNTIISTDKSRNETITPISNFETTPVITTIRSSETTLPSVQIKISDITFPSLDSSSSKTSAPQFCVTIIAQPSKRALTEGEQAFNEATNIFEKFFSKAFGMG
ncbi:hypothetical protein HHI36_009554 [Cryptolaemus montrouzieri]|uniref:Uncharacterized protein n=1 Tax=Cryptolaemus montrouzieri TaxID=559131 RepID=A0ABD2MGU4_9CUCU